MPIQSIKLIPGINVERTPTLLEAAYTSSQLGRFRDGLFQKIGGWEKFFPFAVSGIPRELHAWQDLNAVDYLAYGTNTQLGVIYSDTLRDITPQKKTTDFSPSFDTTNTSHTVTVHDSNITNVFTYDAVYFNTPIAVGGIILSGAYQVTANGGSGIYQIYAASAATSTVSAGGAVPTFTTTSGSVTVTVNLTAHGLSVGDTASFPKATTGGGITIGGAQSSYTAVTIPTANSFTISVSSPATSSTTFSMNSGSAEIVYHIALGPLPAAAGYGTGGYGEGGYGTGATPTEQTGTPITSTNWSEDNWGALLVAGTNAGPIYYWDPNGGFATAQIMPNAPIFNGGCFVSMPQRILVAWASTAQLGIGVQQDPLLIKWCDVDDFTTWTASSINQAGSYRLPTGSHIVGGMQGPQQGLFWTDIDLWAMSYIGPPLVFGFNKIGSGCGLAGQHAATLSGGSVYWMGTNNFFILSGNGVQVIPCPVWDVVFQDLDLDNAWKCVAGSNTLFNEIIWFYPSESGGTGECDKYVKVNTSENVWDYGNLPRTAWMDQSVLGNPIAATPTSLIYQHEMTQNGDGAAISTTMQTGFFVISEGHNMSFVDWIWPDMKWGLFGGSQTAEVYITILAADYPNDTPTSYGPYLMTASTTYINTRIRARLMAIKVQSSDLGSFWRLGNLRIRFAADGTR